MSSIDPFKINEAVLDLWRCYIVERDMAKELETENARLKAEVERLTAKQTDIERVQAQSDFYRNKLMNETAYTANVQLLDQVKHLEAQVERLTKAGDAMAKAIRWLPQSISDHHLDAWNAAKEGKQS